MREFNFDVPAFEGREPYAPPPPPPASVGQRAIAYALDLLAATAVSGLLRALMSKLGANFDPTFFVWMALAVALPRRAGQTLGMKFAKLRICEADGDDPPTYGRLAAREFARLVFLFPGLGLPLLSMFARDDRRGWHDRLARARVISLADPDEAGVVVWKGIAAFALAIVALAGGGAYVALYTSYPLKQACSMLELAGYTVEGARGSWKRGYEIARIERNSPDADLSISGLRFKTKLASRDGAREFVIQDLSVESARVALHPAAKPKATASEPTKPARADESSERPAAKSAARPSRFRLDRVRVESLDLGDVAIQSQIRGVEGSFALKRFYLENVVLDARKASIAGDRAWIESDFFDLDLRGFEFGKGLARMDAPLSVTLKPNARPELIKKPIDLRMQIDVRDSSVQTASLDAFAGALRARCEAGRCSARLTKWEPAQWLKIVAPINEVDVRASGTVSTDPRKMKLAEFDAAANWRGMRFRSKLPAFVHDRQNKRFYLAPATAKPDVKLARAFRLVPAANPSASAREALADLLYDRVPAQLAPQELAVVEADSTFFAEPPPAAAAPAIAARPASGPGGALPARAFSIGPPRAPAGAPAHK